MKPLRHPSIGGAAITPELDVPRGPDRDTGWNETLPRSMQGKPGSSGGAPRECAVNQIPTAQQQGRRGQSGVPRDVMHDIAPVSDTPQQTRVGQTKHPQWRRTASIAAGFLAVVATVSACGGSPSTRPVAAGTTTTTTANPSACVSTEVPAPSTGPLSPLLPEDDPFYRWSGSLTHDAPGVILRTRTIPYSGEFNGTYTPVSATQLLYVTTDELGCRTVSVVTVFHPLDDSAGGARLISYQTSYDALGAQCDPSYTLETGTEGETGFIMGYVTTGYTVVMADYEGEDAAYGVGQQSGYETLDALRAAETLLGVPEISTPVGMLGYSGGAVASEFASELAPTDAPRLDIVGVAEGGIPVDLFHNLSYIDNPDSSWTGQIPSYLDGLARGFDIHDLDRYFTPQGIAAANADQTQCSGTFTGLTTEQMFKPQYQDFDEIPVFVRAFDKQIMSRSGTPRGPLFIGNGLSDSVGDGVTVTKDVQELAYIYCQRGVPVEFHIYNGQDHDQAGTSFFAEAQTFLAQRFEKLPFQSGCAGIARGNSIAPVSVDGS
jgi:hypothetical protein